MSTESNTLAVPPPVRRIITGHNSEGMAIVLEDNVVIPRDAAPIGTGQFSDLFWTDNFPANNNEEFKDVIKAHVNEIVSPGGSAFRTVDIPPGGGSVGPLLYKCILVY